MSSADIVAGILDNSKEVDRLRKELDELQRWLKNLVITLYQDFRCYTLKQKSSRRLKPESGEQKKKRIKGDADVLRLSPSTRSHLESPVNMKGEQVAARVSQEDAGRDKWFVVKVINFDKEAREFEVLDEEPGDDEEGGARENTSCLCHILYLLQSGQICLVSKIFHPENMSWRSIQKRLHCTKPRLSKLERGRLMIVLEFDDDEEDGSLPQRLVSFHRVVPLPEGYRQ